MRVIDLTWSTALCAALASAAAPAKAYRTGGDLHELESTEPVGWTTGLVAFDVTGALPDDVAQQDLEEAFSVAAGTWAQIDCFGPSIQLSGLEQDDYAAADRKNTLAFVPAEEMPGGLPPDAPAVTELQYEQDASGLWHIVEADIYVNADRDWAGGDDGSSVDLATALAHELGHVIGLLHPCEPDGAGGAPECTGEHESALMFPLYYDQGAGVSEDDELGYCHLYDDVDCLPGSRRCPSDEVFEPCAPGACGDAGVDDASIQDEDVADEDDDDVACEGRRAIADASDAECPAPLEFASACTTGSECASGLCIGAEDRGATCTRTCGGEDGPCPLGFSCESVGGQAVCLGERDESGCNVAAVGARTASSATDAAALLCMLIAMATGVRRRTRLL